MQNGSFLQGRCHQRREALEGGRSPRLHPASDAAPLHTLIAGMPYHMRL